jgi:hypothetical protein
VAVAASKLSTYYHRHGEIGSLPNGWTMDRFRSVRRAFFSHDFDSRSVKAQTFVSKVSFLSGF